MEDKDQPSFGERAASRMAEIIRQDRRDGNTDRANKAARIYADWCELHGIEPEYLGGEHA